MPLGGILSVHLQATVALRFSRRAIKPTQRLKIWLSTVYRGAYNTGQTPCHNGWAPGRWVNR